MTLVKPISAHMTAAAIASGETTPERALAQCSERMEAHEETLCVFAHRPAQLKIGDGPLRGILLGIKDVFETRDMPTGYGSPIYGDHQPVADAALVSMLKQAGATIAGKTVTTEFAWFEPGPTRNPHNTDHTPGGSSSGSAAGVAAGFFPAAIGTQTGGSIIRPAAFCGVSGFKPSFRLFPTVGLKHFSWSLDTVGFFAASASDCGLVAAACSGRDLDVTLDDDTAPRIGLYHGGDDHLMSDAMEMALSSAVQLAAKAGARITDIEGPERVEAARLAHPTVQDFEARLALADELHHSPGGLSKKLRDHLEAADDITPAQYDDARRTANHARKASHDLFADCDVLLTASAPGAAPHSLRSTGDSAFNRLWTLLGLPCVNVPGMKDTTGLPLGVQIIAPFGKDKRALQVAHWLERVLAG
ncbi:MAG: amidase [Ahrensia sp.]|nr:amidase [Ahrensia sp.]